MSWFYHEFVIDSVYDVHISTGIDFRMVGEEYATPIATASAME